MPQGGDRAGSRAREEFRRGPKNSVERSAAPAPARQRRAGVQPNSLGGTEIVLLRARCARPVARAGRRLGVRFIIFSNFVIFFLFF